MKMVAYFHSKTRSDLELPLTWHDFSIRSRYVDTSGEASSVVGVSDDSAEANVRADRAVVWSLRSWVTIGRPSQRPFRELVGCREHDVLLLNAKPRFFTLSYRILKHLLRVVSEVSVGRNEFLARRIFPFESLCHDKDVVTSAEGIWEVGAWFQNDF